MNITEIHKTIRSRIKKIFNFKLNPYADYRGVLEQIIKCILIILLIIGAPTVFIGTIEAIQLGQPVTAMIYIALFIPLAAIIIFRKKINYRLKAVFIAVLIYIFAVHNVVVYGFSGAGIPLFLTCFIMITIFFGMKAGLVAVFITLIPMGTIGYLMIHGIISVNVDLMHISGLPVSWITASAVLLLLGTLMVVSYSFIQYNLLHIVQVTQNQSEKLKDANENLKQEIDRKENIQRELQNAKEKAEESDRLKSAFLANMSHEIRTPMNGILGFAQLLDKQDISREKQQEFINHIQKSGERLLATVNDLIDISRIETGQIEVSHEIINLNQEIVDIVNFFTTEANGKGIDIGVKDKLPGYEARIKTDQMKFSSVLRNLIKNAIKYTEHGSIAIGCKREGQYIRFYVADTGIGIPEDRQDAIFNRFVQADIADTRAYEGSGLGLSIARSYIELLGGKIWVESIEGQGSTFYFNLPGKQ